MPEASFFPISAHNPKVEECRPVQPRPQGFRETGRFVACALITMSYCCSSTLAIDLLGVALLWDRSAMGRSGLRRVSGATHAHLVPRIHPVQFPLWCTIEDRKEPDLQVSFQGSHIAAFLQSDKAKDVMLKAMQSNISFCTRPCYKLPCSHGIAKKAKKRCLGYRLVATNPRMLGHPAPG